MSVCKTLFKHCFGISPFADYVYICVCVCMGILWVVHVFVCVCVYVCNLWVIHVCVRVCVCVCVYYVSNVCVCVCVCVDRHKVRYRCVFCFSFSSISCPSAKLYKDEEVEEILQIKSTSEVSIILLTNPPPPHWCTRTGSKSVLL